MEVHTARQSDAQAFKELQRKNWQRAAAHWRKYDEQLCRNGAAITGRLLDLASIQSGHRVLDIASGTGEPGLPAARIAGPSGFVLLTDQSPEMLAVARDKANAQGLHNVDFRVSDAEQLQLDPESFDAALWRGSLMLMPDPVRCLRLVYESLKPGGRIAVLVVGRPEANPYFTIPRTVLRKYVSLPHYDPTAPGIFAFANPDRLRSVLARAGFCELHSEQVESTSQLEGASGREYWEYMRESSFVAALLAQIPAGQHEKIGEEIAAMACGDDADGKVKLPCESILAAGVR